MHMRRAGAVTLFLLPACLSFPRADACRRTDALCDDPPAAACDGQAVRSYEASGTCDRASGTCGYASSLFHCQAFETCIDGACVCNAGSCLCTTRDDCPGGDLCIVNDCVNGSCQRTPTSVSCDDHDLCTQIDTCVSGVCRGTDPVICEAIDTCHEVAECNPATGACSQVVIPAGVPCDDGNACTDDDTCNPSGACIGTERRCLQPPAADCHDDATVRTYQTQGECDTNTGACEYPTRLTPCPSTSFCSAGVCECLLAGACE